LSDAFTNSEPGRAIFGAACPACNELCQSAGTDISAILSARALATGTDSACAMLRLGARAMTAFKTIGKLLRLASLCACVAVWSAPAFADDPPPNVKLPPIPACYGLPVDKDELLQELRDMRIRAQVSLPLGAPKGDPEFAAAVAQAKSNVAAIDVAIQQAHDTPYCPPFGKKATPKTPGSSVAPPSSGSSVAPPSSGSNVTPPTGGGGKKVKKKKRKHAKRALTEDDPGYMEHYQSPSGPGSSSHTKKKEEPEGYPSGPPPESGDKPADQPQHTPDIPYSPPQTMPN